MLEKANGALGSSLHYEAEVMMADSTSRRHTMEGASEAEVEQRIMNLYPEAVAILVRDRTGPKAWFGSYIKRA
jgi:hypothetical protein